MIKDMRFVGEWEQQSYVVLAMPHKDTHWSEYLQEAQDKITEIAINISKFEYVIMIYKYERDVSHLTNIDKIICIHINTNDTWCRDFAPISCIKNGRVIMHNFIFNAWGDKFDWKLDNRASQRLHRQYFSNKVTFKSHNFILEGGSIDSNGEGILLTTKSCLLNKNRNKMTQSMITKKLKKYFNAKKILWLHHGYLEGDDTDSHIDNLARFVNSNTIAYIQCNDTSDEHYVELKKMECELENLRDLNGNKFNLIPFPMPNKIVYNDCRLPASYINFLVINNAVLLPVFDDVNDKHAIELIQAIYTTRTIIPIDSRILLRQGGSIHCLSMNIPKPY